MGRNGNQSQRDAEELEGEASLPGPGARVSRRTNTRRAPAAPVPPPRPVVSPASARALAASDASAPVAAGAAPPQQEGAPRQQEGAGAEANLEDLLADDLSCSRRTGKKYRKLLDTQEFGIYNASEVHCTTSLALHNADLFVDVIVCLTVVVHEAGKHICCAVCICYIWL